jgi:putative photosynthetic complex assembly protein
MTEIFVEPEPGTSADSTIKVPRAPLIGAAVLALLAYSIAISARVFGVGAAVEPVSVPIEERAIRFMAQPDGSLEVMDVNTGREIVRLTSDGGNGFLFGALRGITYKRSIARVAPETPFALTRWQNGKITLDDPSTGMHIAVNSFGPTQVASFERLFAAEVVER